MHMGNLPEYMSVYHMDVGCLRGQKRVLEFLEPESQTVVSHHWVLESDPRSSGRATLPNW